MYSSVNTTLWKEIDTKARDNLSFMGLDTKAYSLLMKMKMQLDCHNQEGTRLPKDLCILYKRFIIQANEKVIPELQRDHNFQKQALSLSEQVVSANAKLLKLMQRLQS